jgi:hypothetical protein
MEHQRQQTGSWAGRIAIKEKGWNLYCPNPLYNNFLLCPYNHFKASSSDLKYFVSEVSAVL